MGAETFIDIRKLQAEGGGDPGDLILTSSDESINIFPFAGGFDLTLNTSIVELIDFTNFHNTYIRDEIDWTSEHGDTLRHSIVDCSLSGETLTIVNRSQAGSDSDGREHVFYFSRSVESSNKCYIPLCGVDATDCLSCFKVAIWFGTELSTCYNTNVLLLSDTPSNLSWCMAKNIPFHLVGKRLGNQLFAFIEIPSWFVGRIEINIDRLKRRSGSNIFSYKADPLASSGYSYQGYHGSGMSELYAFDNLNNFSDIVPTINDQYGVLDVDFFVDSMSVLEIQSDNTIPDWIINDLCVHELLLRNKMDDIIIKNTQSAIERNQIPNVISEDTSGASVTLTNFANSIVKITNGGTVALSTSDVSEGQYVKIYADGTSVTCEGVTIPSGNYMEFLFLGNSWRASI